MIETLNVDSDWIMYEKVGEKVCEWKTDGNMCDTPNWRDTFNAVGTAVSSLVGTNCANFASANCNNNYLNRNKWAFAATDVKQYPNKNCLACGKGYQCGLKSLYNSDPQYTHLTNYCKKFTTNTACIGDMGGLSYVNY